MNFQSSSFLDVILRYFLKIIYFIQIFFNSLIFFSFYIPFKIHNDREFLLKEPNTSRHRGKTVPLPLVPNSPTYNCHSHLCLFLLFSTFYFILEYSWLTMLCYFQMYNKVIQLYIYMYLFLFKFFSWLGCYRILSRVPWAIQ